MPNPGEAASVLREYCTTRFGEPLDEARQGATTRSDEKQRAAAAKLEYLLRDAPALANVKDTGTHRASGASPVHVAVAHANVHALAVLIAAGADLRVLKNNGASALHVAIHAFGQGREQNPMAGPVISAEEWECRCLQCFELLLSAGADIHTCHSSVGGDGFDLIVACTAHEHSRADVCLPFLKRLLALGCRVDSLHSIDQSDGLRITGATALIWAVKNGHVRCVELLLLAGADPTSVATFPDCQQSAFECARDDAMYNNDEEALETFALVAAVIKGETTRVIRGGSALDPKAITRCNEELRQRRRLGERMRSGAISSAHREHASRGLRMARELLEANQTQAGRICYLDALLFVFSGEANSTRRSSSSSSSSSALSLPEVALRLSCIGSRDEAFEALHNLVHCEQVNASQSQMREAHFFARQAAQELAAAFPSRAMAWVAYGKTLYDMEIGLANKEGYDTKAAAYGRKSTSSAMQQCVERARMAADCAEHVTAIDNLARGADMRTSKREARSYELYCQAVRAIEEGGYTPASRAKQVDLCSQSLSLRERRAAKQLRGAVRFEVASSLQHTLGGCDDMRDVATCKVLEGGSDLTVLQLLRSLMNVMPEHSCTWTVAMAKLSRSWRAAAIVGLQEAAFLELEDVVQSMTGCDNGQGMTSSQAVVGAGSHEMEEVLTARFNFACALASSGRFEEARSAAAEVWAARLAEEAGDLAKGGGHRSGGGCFSHALADQATYSAWADHATHALKSGARFVGLMATGGELPPMVRATENGIRTDLASALLAHAECMREGGATPAALLSRVLSAQSVAGGDFIVPPPLQRAIRGWAGERGSQLSATELDDLWGSMLHATRAGRGRGGQEGTTPRADAAIAESFLEGLVPREAREPRVAGESGKKTRRKKGKRGKGKAGGGGGKQRKEEKEEEEEADEEDEAEAAVDGKGAHRAVPDVSDVTDQLEAADVSAKEEPPNNDAECSVCFETATEIGLAFLVMPCAGRHDICRPCAREWRVQCLKNGAEFSCPMCRESLEGWEPG